MPLDQVRLDLDEDAIEELMDLARAADRLPKILAAVVEVGTPQVGTMAVARRASEKAGLPPAELRRLFVTLLNFYHTQVRLKLTPDETAEAVARNLKRIAKGEDDAERVKTWERARAKIIEAASQLYPDHPLESAYKAFRVAASRQYELIGMRIYTDARPVFNEAGDAIIQTVITHVLSVDYHDGNSHRVVQFYLDAGDATELREMCERAERKAAVLKRDLSQAPWPTSIFREQADEATSN